LVETEGTSFKSTYLPEISNNMTKVKGCFSKGH